MANNYYKAKEGMVYKRIIDGLIMGDELYLYEFIDGTEDSINNYIEVEKPLEFEDVFYKR